MSAWAPWAVVIEGSIMVVVRVTIGVISRVIIKGLLGRGGSSAWQRAN